MDYPAILMNRQAAPHTRVSLISPGAMESGRGYDTWRPEGSGDCLLIYTRSGQGYCRPRNRDAIALDPGSVLLWETGAWQDYGTDPAVGAWKIVWAHFNPRPHWRPWMSWPVRGPGARILKLTPPHRRPVDEAMEAALRLSRAGLPLAAERAMNTLERALLEIHAAAEELPGSGMDPRIRQIVEFLATLPRADCDGTALARRCGLSESRFAHVFREQTGTTPQRMLESNRLRVAAQLLRDTRLNVREIADEVGYEDAFYFSRRFRAHHGTAPTAYRKRLG